MCSNITFNFAHAPIQFTLLMLQYVEIEKSDEVDLVKCPPPYNASHHQSFKTSEEGCVEWLAHLAGKMSIWRQFNLRHSHLVLNQCGQCQLDKRVAKFRVAELRFIILQRVEQEAPLNLNMRGKDQGL